MAIAACETAASFIINGSSRNLDYHLLKKLGPFTSDHKIRNFITLPAFLSDPYTVVRSSSVFTFLDLVCSHFLEIVYQKDSLTQSQSLLEALERYVSCIIQ